MIIQGQDGLEVILSAAEYRSLERVSGCSGSKVLLNNNYLMVDSFVEKKDKTNCLKTILFEEGIHVDNSTISLFSEMMDHPIDYILEEKKKKKAIHEWVKSNCNYSENELYEAILKACRRYTSACIFDIAKVSIGESIAKRYVLYYKMACYYNLKKNVAAACPCNIRIDKKKLNGCLIRKVNGFDIAKWEKEKPESKKALKECKYAGSFLRTVSSLHILDCISGFVDRNPSNLIYLINDGLVHDAVAIDNDVSFGNALLSDYSDTRLGIIQDIEFVDSVFFQRLISCKESEIIEILKQSLSEDEIRCFILRYQEILRILKKAQQIKHRGWDSNIVYCQMQNHPYIKSINQCVQAY